MKLVREQFNYGLDKADMIIFQIGAAYEDFYVRRTFDCEDHARLRAALAIFFIAKEYGVKGKGVPIGTLGYVRDDGARHVDVQAIVAGEGRVLANAYAGRSNPALSKREEKSIFLDVI
jgi:hypothetical protein